MLTLAITLLTVIGLRTGLHFAGYHVGPFEFWPVHLLAIVLLSYLAGHRELREDRNASLNDMVRIALRDVVLYAVVMAVFAWVFYRWVDPAAFIDRNALLVQGFVEQGFSEEEARKKVGGFFTAANYAGITFLVLLVSGAINALAMSAIHHKLLRRFMR